MIYRRELTYEREGKMAGGRKGPPTSGGNFGGKIHVLLSTLRKT